jgi:hypothetical protein
VGDLGTNVVPQPFTTLPKPNAPVGEGGSLSGVPMIVNAYAGGVNKEVKLAHIPDALSHYCLFIIGQVTSDRTYTTSSTCNNFIKSTPITKNLS